MHPKTNKKEKNTMTTAAAIHATEVIPNPMSLVQNIPLSRIQESKTNPRRQFDETRLAELADNIRLHGVLQPILVRPLQGGEAESYELVAGARRYRASKLAKCESIPATIRELTDPQCLELQLIENLQRADVHELDEARGYAALMQMQPDTYTVETVAEKIGRSEKYVYARLRLTHLIEDVQRGKRIAVKVIDDRRSVPNQSECRVRDGYTSHHGKARRASLQRRLSKRYGSPTLSEGKYPQTRQAQSSMGVAVVGRLHQGKRQYRTTATVSRSCARFRGDAPRSPETSRDSFGSAQSEPIAAAIHAGVRRLRRPLFRASFLSNTQTFHATALPPNSNDAPFACFWKLPASRNRNARPATVYFAEAGGRFGMGIRQSSAQSCFQGFRAGDEMELLCRRESGKWCFAARESSGSPETRPYPRTDSASPRTAEGTGSNDGALRNSYGDESWGNFGVAPQRHQLCGRPNPDRADELSRLVRLAQNQKQQTFSSHSQSTRSSARSYVWTLRANRGRDFGISNLPRHTAQRYESFAPAFEAGRRQSRSALAQLAHSE